MGNRNALIEPFTAAVNVALREMAGVETVLNHSCIENRLVEFSGIYAVLKLTSRKPGLLVLSMPEGTARALTERILAATAVTLDAAMVRDCIGELANIIAGQAKTLLYGTPDHFNLSPPQTEGFDTLKADWIELSFGSDVGDLTLLVHLPE